VKSLKFSDMILAAASLAIVSKIIYFPMALALYPPLGVYNGSLTGVVVAILASAIIIGYVYSQKFREENRTRAITKTTVLLAAFIWVTSLLETASAADWTPKIRAEWLTLNPTATPTAAEWYYIENLIVNLSIFTSIILAFALGFIGLYLGSALRKGKKT
jgi:ABC-type bacteriocin/lantibiotic exporter with double-glycine peptidase domain